MSYINLELNVNGFSVKARYFQEDINNLFLPLIKKLSDMQIKKEGRLIVYLAAPPGAGKTTLSLFLSHLSKINKDITCIQPIGLDGYHYPQEYIEKHNIIINGESVPMRRFKGSPETFDLQKLTENIKLMREKNIKCPVYDRNLHDVVPDIILIKENIVLIEGNWLLLDEPGWRGLIKLCDYSIFISAEENMLKERLMQRKISGGASPHDAREFYARSDSANIARALNNRVKSDCGLALASDGRFSML